jgi:hypothetical protein
MARFLPFAAFFVYLNARKGFFLLLFEVFLLSFEVFS